MPGEVQIIITTTEKGVWPASCPFAAAQNGDLALVASATRALCLRNALLVEPNRIRDLIYACIRLVFAKFLTLKMSHTCTYRSMTQDIHPMLALMSITFFPLLLM